MWVGGRGIKRSGIADGVFVMDGRACHLGLFLEGLVEGGEIIGADGTIGVKADDQPIALVDVIEAFGGFIHADLAGETYASFSAG